MAPCFDAKGSIPRRFTPGVKNATPRFTKLFLRSEALGHSAIRWPAAHSDDVDQRSELMSITIPKAEARRSERRR
jgi:hypothetical protein